MKSISIILTLILAGVHAANVPYLPQVENEHAVEGLSVVGDAIAAALEGISYQIREAGLDPWTLDIAAFDYELPVPVILSIDAIAENIVFSGLSEIVINRIDFSLLGRLTLDISLPEISISIGNAALDAVALGANINGHISGRLAVVEPRVSGVIVLNYIGGIIGGSLIRSVDLEFGVDKIEYNGRFNLFGIDLSQRINTFVSVNILNAIEAHKDELSELIEIIVRQVVDGN